MHDPVQIVASWLYLGCQAGRSCLFLLSFAHTSGVDGDTGTGVLCGGNSTMLKFNGGGVARLAVL